LHAGNHVRECLPILLRMWRLRICAAPETEGLLRFLLIWIGEVSAHSGTEDCRKK
jgi:hypothetical protein